MLIDNNVINNHYYNYYYYCNIDFFNINNHAVRYTHQSHTPDTHTSLHSTCNQATSHLHSVNMTSTYIIDIQGFRGNNKEFILKSLAYSKLNDGNYVQQIIFKPPYDIQQLISKRRHEAHYASNNLHLIQWDDGFIKYSDMEETVQSLFTHVREIYVKGLEKATFLNNILKRNICMDMDILHCPNLKTLKLYHPDQLQGPVACKQVSLLRQWFKDLLSKSSSLTNQSVNSLNEYGLDFLTPFEIFFLPIPCILQSCSSEILTRNIRKLPPKIRNNAFVSNLFDKNSHF
uniref:Uncharacterized protein n=4 Tax=Cacopsylla melanoneura TaxID=428564 RepID=A0A8D8X3J6_9HEMI